MMLCFGLTLMLPVTASGKNKDDKERAKGDPPVVEKVELDRYLGQWYELARLPAKFQKDCYASKANYKLREDGRIDVTNTCRQGSIDGPVKEAKGVAWVVDKKTNAKLKVRFVWPFSGDYWILKLGENYEYSLVGTRNRKYLWLLSRTPTMEQALFEEIISYARSIGFDTDPLIVAQHPAK